MIGIGAGVAAAARCWCCTTCWAYRRQAAAVRAQLHGGQRRHARKRCERYVAAVKDGSFPDDELHATGRPHAHRPHPRRTARTPRPPTPARLRAHHGQPARRATWRWSRRPSRWATSRSPASSSTACSSCRTRTSTPTRAPGRRLRQAAKRPAATCCSRPTRASCIPNRRPTRCTRRRLADILEGHFRPGFFVGVCTVVMKLFACVQPRRGRVRQEGLPAADGHPPHGAAVRAADRDRGRRNASAPTDGLALSSRNGYLSDAERAEAVQLSRALRRMAAQVKGEPATFAAIEAEAMTACSRAAGSPTT